MLRPTEERQLATIRSLEEILERRASQPSGEPAPLTEGCPYHPGIEFPAWLCCPRCREEGERAMQTAFLGEVARTDHARYVRIMREGEALPFADPDDVRFAERDRVKRLQTIPSDVVCFLLISGACALALILWLVGYAAGWLTYPY
jgi:hypothetical protein